MSRKPTKSLMRQQSKAATHESYWVRLWTGGGGSSFSYFHKPPTDKGLRNFL
jgi:hypothetical protein